MFPDKITLLRVRTHARAHTRYAIFSMTNVRKVRAGLNLKNLKPKKKRFTASFEQFIDITEPPR